MGNLGGLIIIFLALTIGASVIFFILTIMRTHRLVIRSPDSNQVIGYYWCSEWKDKTNGSLWWKSVFFQRKIKIPEPPDEVVCVNHRGKRWVEVYRLSDSEYCYIQDKGLHGEDVLIENNKIMSDSFKPFTVVQRQVVVGQFAKAEAMRQHSWLKENGMNLASAGFMFMIIMMGIVYSGELFQGINSVQSGASSMITQASKAYQGAVSGAKDLTAAASSATVVQRGTEDPPK